MEDLLTGNPALVLEEIYAVNYPWLESYVLRNSGNTSDAQDIFQESISAAWINLKQGRFSGDRGQFNAYLRQICKFKWINHLKSAAYKKTSFAHDLNLVDATDHSAEDLEKQLELGNQLKYCFAQLGEKCRELLALFYYRKKSLAEIAMETKNTEESTKTIKYRCMMRLRKLFLDQNKDNVQL